VESVLEKFCTGNSVMSRRKNVKKTYTSRKENDKLRRRK
jgi:hypothetical protein